MIKSRKYEIISGPNINPVIPKYFNPIITPSTVTIGCTSAIFFANTKRIKLSLVPMIRTPHTIIKQPCQVSPFIKVYIAIGNQTKELPTNGIIEANPVITPQNIGSLTLEMRYANVASIMCNKIMKDSIILFQYIKIM